MNPSAAQITLQNRKTTTGLSHLQADFLLYFPACNLLEGTPRMQSCKSLWDMAQLACNFSVVPSSRQRKDKKGSISQMLLSLSFVS